MAHHHFHLHPAAVGDLWVRAALLRRRADDADRALRAGSADDERAGGAGGGLQAVVVPAVRGAARRGVARAQLHGHHAQPHPQPHLHRPHLRRGGAALPGPHRRPRARRRRHPPLRPADGAGAHRGGVLQAGVRRQVARRPRGDAEAAGARQPSDGRGGVPHRESQEPRRAADGARGVSAGGDNAPPPPPKSATPAGSSPPSGGAQLGVAVARAGGGAGALRLARQLPAGPGGALQPHR
mmetsp:Transcript_3774/g.7791  ORF Transcript_3774/g.7791 Transcript_3774/m.7791 type:complete len:239 (+) Transcript_3774:755-1471(+)